jgi:hypothetical protein
VCVCVCVCVRARVCVAWDLHTYVHTYVCALAGDYSAGNSVHYKNIAGSIQEPHLAFEC